MEKCRLADQGNVWDDDMADVTHNGECLRKNYDSKVIEKYGYSFRLTYLLIC